MGTRRFKAALGCMVLASTACSAPGGSAAANGLLGEFIPPIVAQSERLGPVDPHRPITLQWVLPQQDPDGLRAFIESLYNPLSINYQQYLTPQGFAARFGPHVSDVRALQNSLAAAGLLAAPEVQGSVLSVYGTVDAVQNFFHTTLYEYTAPDGTPFFAPDAAVAVPSGLPAVSISGLSQGLPLHRAAMQRSTNPGAVTLLSDGLRQAYGVPASLRGDGQTLALYELDGYDPRDIDAFAALQQTSAPPLQNILVGGFDGSPGAGATEVVLDIDVLMAVAPAVAQIRVYEGANPGGSLQVWNEMANPTLGDKVLPTIVSSSWGVEESQISSADVAAEAQVFAQMAAQGQSVFAASGDGGAFDAAGILAVDDPASQPFVVAVGGTSLATDAAGAYSSESTWVSSTGGVSMRWQIPDWQVAAVSGASQGSQSKRNVPDVASDADPNSGLTIVVNGATIVGIGGTSAAAPQWASFIALANQQRAASNLAPVGFVGPLLYAIAASNPGSFHDVQDGSTNGYYAAVPGYDDATGWGSCNVAAMLSSLSQGFSRSTFTAPSWLQP